MCGRAGAQSCSHTYTTHLWQSGCAVICMIPHTDNGIQHVEAVLEAPTNHQKN